MACVADQLPEQVQGNAAKRRIAAAVRRVFMECLRDKRWHWGTAIAFAIMDGVEKVDLSRVKMCNESYRPYFVSGSVTDEDPANLIEVGARWAVSNAYQELKIYVERRGSAGHHQYRMLKKPPWL